jgi:acyl-CoA dehydrogenase
LYDFETDPENQAKLDWAAKFVADEVDPLDHVFPDPFDRSKDEAMAIVRPLMDRVREQGLWACHLGPELGGPGYGQVKLALLNEILGRSAWGPSVFGCQAPDSGNAEIIAHFGTPDQKARYLKPLLDGEMVSCYAMTEPQGGSDPRLFTARARREGDDWVINGESGSRRMRAMRRSSSSCSSPTPMSRCTAARRCSSSPPTHRDWRSFGM